MMVVTNCIADDLLIKLVRRSKQCLDLDGHPFPLHWSNTTCLVANLKTMQVGTAYTWEQVCLAVGIITGQSISEDVHELDYEDIVRVKPRSG